MDSQSFGYSSQEGVAEKIPPENILASHAVAEASQAHVLERKTREKRTSRRFIQEIARKEDSVVSDMFEEEHGSRSLTDNPISPNACPQKEGLVKHKVLFLYCFFSSPSPNKF